MDVNSISFYPLLLDMLTDISASHFVAIDLELSGVPSKAIHSLGKQTLQQRYTETKEAAERYQILQIGLTCVSQDTPSQKYILKPYNFHLSPIVGERGLGIDRIFAFQSGAVEFLLKVGFDMSTPFTHGVPYLSRAESREAREKHAQRQDRSAVADIQVKPTETESLAFLDRVRSDITSWRSGPSFHTQDYINIRPLDSSHLSPDGQEAKASAELSRFEKRLVHQLVRAEFPDLVSLSHGGSVRLVRFDQEREDRIAADRKRESSERINRQKGMRWIIEALLGSDLGRLDLRECARDVVTGEHVFADMLEYRAQFHRAQTLLRGNPRVIVGHNCFLDLIYIYRAFIGELPDTVTEFQEKIHALWPLVVDTKYMSTHNCSDINPVSSLEQIAEQLKRQSFPIVETAKEHRKYEEVEALHEAGYDSFLTAQIAVRLSSKLEKEGAYVDPGKDTIAKDANSLRLPNGTAANHCSSAAAYGNNNITTTTATTTTTSSTTSSQSTEFIPSQVGGRWKRRGDPTVPHDSEETNDPWNGTYDPKNLKHHYKDPALAEGFEGGMPRMGSDFWRVYGNKLRVFGTEEAMCVLDAGPDENGEGSGGEGEGEGGVGQGGVSMR